MSDPRCASCGHEPMLHSTAATGGPGSPRIPVCYGPDEIHPCPCTGWQEPSVPEPRTPEAALAEAIDAVNLLPFVTTDESGWPAESEWQERPAVFVSAPLLLQALTAAGWSLVRTPTDGDLTVEVLAEALERVGLWPQYPRWMHQHRKYAARILAALQEPTEGRA